MRSFLRGELLRYYRRNFSWTSVNEARRRASHADVDVFCQTLPENERNILDQYSSLRRRISTPSSLYCVEQTVADRVANLVLNDGTANPVLEVRPGPGLITRAMLRQGIPAIRLFQDSALFGASSIKRDFPDAAIDSIMDDLLLLSKRDYADFQDPTEHRVARLLDGLQPAENGWRGDPALKIVGTLCSRKDMAFLRYMTSSCLSRRTLFQFGRVRSVFIVPSSIYEHVTARPTSGFILYKSSNILLQLLFDVKLLDTVPRSAFFPWPLAKNVARKRRSNFNEDHMYIVSIEAKRDIPGVPETQMRELAFFIFHHLTSRSRTVIPALEQWIPGCGVKLIEQGHGIFTRFGDLEPDKLKDLFLIFASHPEYESCAFKEALNLAQDAIDFPFSLADVSEKKPGVVPDLDADHDESDEHHISVQPRHRLADEA
ncbi:unnamed protein product [Notodromas monacha]|uniref:rRNA adenine N(6)-methyltransferase n=1 Tax=Notodromas monacha TaxID=399045 RepID=A0A7R9BPQ9_9CRUS|nr:unnamed protein product [Notodromas monacha]CAG0918048.1 unnamed protein product [Notodromas monacha]